MQAFRLIPARCAVPLCFHSCLTSFVSILHSNSVGLHWAPSAMFRSSSCPKADCFVVRTVTPIVFLFAIDGKTVLSMMTVLKKKRFAVALQHRSWDRSIASVDCKTSGSVCFCALLCMHGSALTRTCICVYVCMHA